MGKPHAMQQLAGHASGEYLMFTDADTVHGRESIAWAVTNLECHRADCVSGYVFQEMNTLGELFIVPATYIMSAMLLPLWLITALPAPALSFAIGQLLMFRRSAFEAIGGYSRVRGQISDDLAIARELKRAGFREVFLDIRRHVRCRMYDGYRASFNGLSKNIYDIARHRSILFAAAVTLLVTFVVLPLALLPIQVLTGAAGAERTIFCVAAFLLAWAVVLYDRGLRWWAPLLYPVLFIHLLYMAWWSFAHVLSGQGVKWKGRTLH
jgi:chlorobactene glucosyltransferase